ncbi:MAG: c-type cytochrome [Planctomycetaceae bacterium]
MMSVQFGNSPVRLLSWKHHSARLLTLLLVCSATPLLGQDEGEDFHPGLLATYSVGDDSVHRVDATLSFDWGGSAPDERLPPGAFTATWSGQLLARLPGTHRFHAFVTGDVDVMIDGKSVLQASAADGFQSGPPVSLSPGDHAIEVRYATPKESDKPRAHLNLFWSSDVFTLEPLPADVLTRESASPQLSAAARGHQLADANRCAACHGRTAGARNTLQSNALEILKAPALDRIAGSHVDRAALIQRIWRPQNVVANSHMPSFDLTPVEAENVAEFLLSVSQDAHEESEIKFKADDVTSGRKLLTSLGCVACHQLPGPGQTAEPLAAPYDGPELVTVAQRRSVGWLDRWLRAPETLNASHRMPVFDLSRDERRQLVAALAQSGGKAVSWSSSAQAISQKERIAEGKRIVIEANCAACHSIPGIDAKPFPQLEANSFGNSSGDCLNPMDIPNLRSKPGLRVPSFYNIIKASNEQRQAGATSTDMEAVPAWFQSFPGQKSISTDSSATGLSLTDQGSILLQRNGCTACHDRNQQLGLSSIANALQKTHPDLAGQSQGMIPPSLTAVGDKLSDDYLRKAVAGEQGERRLPWLLVRMPKFKHSDADRASLMRHFITADRISDAADAARQDVLAHIDLSGQSQATTEDLLLGNQLTGAGGFNCVACHRAGPFEPRNVALGTRGSDIMTMGSRLRPRFFQRWMKNPIRIVAGIEMPAIKKAMPDVLEGSLPAQIGAMWKALSDDRFTPPTVTSRFEQIVNVEPGGQPRIIRDVFTMGTGKDREAVARAMAIGFGNGHNILIDLDTMQVRLWTLGEFARQRTEGKSWYWDMPGFPVQQDRRYASPFVLQAADATLVPLEDEGRTAELLSYRMSPNGVEVTVAWRFLSRTDVDNRAETEPHFAATTWERRAADVDRVVTVHRFTTATSEKPAGSGWQHSVTLKTAPPNSTLTGWLIIQRDEAPAHKSDVVVTTSAGRWSKISTGETGSVSLTTDQSVARLPARPPAPIPVATAETITSTPGFTGHRLPIDTSIMPTAIAWLPDGRMVFTSLKGHVWIAEDTNGDSLPDATSLFEEGLAAPFGILANPDGSIIVAHKPEILRLQDTDGDGRADLREVVASGWGYNDNYHDWTSGLVRDSEGNLFVGLGSDYNQKDRPKNQDRWRGGVIKIDPSSIVTPLAMSMRYPMGLAFDQHGHLFATDNQGVQNTFNEINHIQIGRHYGVPSAHQPTDGLQHETPALMVPHPWTRSVNSILFLSQDFPVTQLRGHGIGCEYDSRFLIRFTVQDVNGVLQGASYRFSRPDQEAGGHNFIGPICSAVSPQGDLFIGSIWDSGWQGGLNTGGIERLGASPEGLLNGIQEVTATPAGFHVEFFKPVDTMAAGDSQSWSIQAYTREWGGSYATPDSGRYSVPVEDLQISDNGKVIDLKVKDLQPGYLYEISTTGPLSQTETLWPAEAHYSLKVVPK